MHPRTTLATLAVAIAVASGYVYEYDFDKLSRLPYCNKAGDIKCCNGRKDDCSHNYADTKCYCDEFCRRKPSNPLHDDCCPDYSRTCDNYEDPEVPPGELRLTTPPPGYTKPDSPRVCQPGQQKKDNCNTCNCFIGDDGYANWECSHDTCIINEEIINDVNTRNEGWTARNYSEFWGRTLADGLKLKLGTLELSPHTWEMLPDETYEKYELPVSFDARTSWANTIAPVIDQGWCGSDWAISTAAVASDRFFIQSNAAQKTRLSAQYLLCSVNENDCEGANIEHAWNIARKHGLVDETCPPANCSKITSFKGGKSTCKVYKTSPWKKLGSPDVVMYEISNSGPVQAIMEVHQDLFHYAGGVYRRSPSPHEVQMSGLHAVRILGWGEENGDEYWIVANSWGTEWGEDGTFRVARKPNPFKMVVVAYAHVDKVDRQPSRFGRWVNPNFKK